MSDATWNDPVDWVSRLNGKLVALDTQYQAIAQIRRMRFDPDGTGNADLIDGDPQSNATLTAAAALAAVVAALKEIPTFQGTVGLTALTDLGLALADLDQGLRPAMLQPRPDVKASTDGSGRRMIKAHVVLCVELLELAGVKNSKARRDVGAIFARHGYKGRKGGPVSAQSIYEWQASVAKHGPDQETRSVIERGHATWKIGRAHV